MPQPDPTHPAFGAALGLLPNDRSYWVIPGRLAAGVFPSHEHPETAEERLRRMLAIGFGYIVDLTEEGEKNHVGLGLHSYAEDICRYASETDRSIDCVRRPIRDMSVPTVETMRTILDGIDAAIATGRRTYIHCWGGFGRTGTVVGCYLARHGLAEGAEALKMIRYLRRTDAKAYIDSPQTSEQRQFVLDWQQGK